MARIIPPSSYEAERVTLKVEYSLNDRNTIARTAVTTLTAMIGIAKVTGSLKLGSTPRGGGMDGIWVWMVPGDSNDTDRMVGRMKPVGSDGLYVSVVAMMPEGSVGNVGNVGSVGMDGMVAGKKIEGINEAILMEETVILEHWEQDGRGDDGRCRPHFDRYRELR